MDFAKLMSKAKANTAQANVLVQFKQAEVEAARKAEAETARRLELQEAERKKREAEARLRREHEQRQLQQRLQEEKAKKRLEKVATAGDESDDALLKAAASGSNGTVGISKHAVSNGLAKASLKMPPMNTAERKKRKRIESLFSDDDDYGSDASARRHGTSGKGKSRSGPGSSASAALKRKAASGNDLLSAKERALLEFNPAEAMKLNVHKRDTRTIEEIEADMRARKRKEAEAAGVDNGPATNVSTSVGMFANRKGQPPMTVRTGRNTAVKSATPDPISKVTKLRRSESPKPSKKASVVPLTKPEAIAQKKQRSHSPSTSRTKATPAKIKQTSRSEEIWKIMYPNRPYRPAIDYDSDNIDRSDDDMEAGYDEIEEEDRAADRAARREDKVELERSEKHAEEKQKLRAQKAFYTSSKQR